MFITERSSPRFHRSVKEKMGALERYATTDEKTSTSLHPMLSKSGCIDRGGNTPIEEKMVWKETRCTTVLRRVAVK